MSPPARQRLLPTMLAGPVLRRAERTRVSIWLATSAPVRPRVEIFRIGSPGQQGLNRVGGGTAETLALGPRLFIHLAGAVPDDAAFPTDVLLAYEVELQSDGSAPVRLGELGLLRGAGALAYAGLPLPTFFIRERIAALNVMHGSCRLLHGEGEDSLLGGDELLARTAADVAQRPSALFLTGDQIYADDVAGALIGHLRELASELMGPEDDRSLPGFPPLSELGVDGRAEAARDRVGFTGPKLDNHLLSFGEFAAMYLTAWNAETWPTRLPPAEEAIGGNQQRRWAAATARRRYARQLANLERARAALPAVRRLLANVPTYMIFDDHDVADDWNLTAEWRDRVHDSPTGRRFIANALAGYFAFQGWGNDPEAYDPSLKQTVAGFLGGGAGVDGASFDSTLWAFDRWAFHAPTSPPTIVLDTRTQRSYDSPQGAARLIGADGRRRVEEIARACGHRPGAPLILVSAVPVYGLELQERRQKYLAGKVGPYEIDFEAWHSNLRGLVDFMQLLIDRLRPSWCLMLSGDIHYGCNALARFAIGPRALPIVQLVSSSQKHSGALSRRALDLLGRLVRRKHERAGWNRPPAMAAGAIRKRLLSRPVSTDEWNEDAPVFLAPRQARRLRIQAPPDYREARIYVPPSQERPSKLVGENNLGVVSLVDARVTHRLLARGRRGTRVHAATMPVGAETLDQIDSRTGPSHRRTPLGRRGAAALPAQTTAGGDRRDTMRAVVQDTYGSPDVLRLRDIDRPMIGDDEVLVRVHAAGVDQGVWHLMAGQPYLVRITGVGLRAPRNPVHGYDVAGRVEAVGNRVTRFRPGDEVFGTCRGSFAEYACAPSDRLAPKPANLTFEQAAAVPISGYAALQAVRDQGRVGPGQRVLIIGAGGGVGTLAVQLAKAFGAEVTGVCSTAKTQLVRSIGADRVIDYTREDFAHRNDRYDVILDIAGNRSVAHLRRALASRGTLVIVGGEGGGRWLGGIDRQLRAHMLSPFVRQKLGTWISTERKEDLEALRELLEAGTITPVVDRTLPLSAVPEAIRYLRDGRAQGKVVITV